MYKNIFLNYLFIYLSIYFLNILFICYYLIRHLVETGKVPPPFVPHTELNVYTKDLIGVFDESSTKDISLTEEEDEAYSNWNFCKKSVFFAEVVDTLKDEAEKNLINVSIDQGICCAVS